ncbi:hypothetical protein JHK82_020690 [Glycine max]|nr:hypothetical protein JHK85_021135 [Glycine max]KAG5135959.1 hypothetical protein JHK82_020690 [Glycine max]
MERNRTRTAFLTQCHILMRRSSLHLFRDVSNYWLRLAMFVLAAISLGTIFFDVGSGDASIEVFQRERLNGHYGLERCLHFSCVLLACILWVENLMVVVVSSIFPNPNTGITVSGGIMILTGLFENEFIGLKLASDQDGGAYISDIEILTKIWQVEMGHSKWVDLAILV